MASSSGFNANGLTLRPIRRPRAYKVFWSSVSSFADSEPPAPEFCLQAIRDPRHIRTIAYRKECLIIENQNSSTRSEHFLKIPVGAVCDRAQFCSSSLLE